MVSNKLAEVIQARSLPGDEVYRSAFFPQDVRTCSLLIAFGLLINFLLFRTDYLLLHNQPLLPWVVALRCVYICFSFGILVGINRLRDPVYFDRFILVLAICTVVFVLLGNLSRPPDYTGYIPLDFCVILALYTLQPGKWLWRVLPPITLSLGSFLLLVLVKSKQSYINPISPLSGYLAVNVICTLVSTTWYRYRRSSFYAHSELKELYHESESRRREIAASEIFWERIIDTSPNMLIVVDGKRRITRVNSALVERLLLSKEAIVGQHCCRLLCGLGELVDHCPQRTICQTQTPQTVETYLPVLGADVRIRSTPLAEGAEGKPANVLIIQDISDWKKSESALRDAREQYRSLVENSHAIIYTITPKGRITYVSPSFRRQLGFEEADVVGKYFKEFVHPEDLAHCEHYKEKLLCSGEEQRGVEYRIYDRNGDLHWHLTDLIPRFNDQGEVESFFGYSFDLTEKKLHEDRLNEAREAAEKASQVKSDFLALVSHEIRTPLNALVGFSGLARRTSDDDQLRQYIEILDQSAHLLMDLVNDVLDMSRVEAGQLRIKDAPFNLVEVLELLRWQFTPLVDKNAGVTMRLELGPELPAWVVGDATRLRQVLSNLLANALKFTDDGSVVLRVQGERSTAKDDYFWLRLEVEDTGIGIDLSKQDLLFEPFQQIDPGISRSYGGTGLGLAIVQRLVTLMGGSIEVQSQLGQGSCFTVRVPVRICAPVVLEQECGGLSSSLLVLVVEDNGFNRLLLEKTLREWGHRVITVENGEEALQRVEERLFDCIILDLWMPNLNGLELAGRLRSRERALKQGQTPIIAYTADTDERTRERAVQAGMQEVLCKPLDLQKLCVVLRTYCTGARAKTGESGAIEQKNKSDQELQSFGLAAKVMVDMGSDQARIVTYAHLLWEDIEAEKNKLDQAFLLSNREQILEAAHSLKGLCGYLADGQAGELALRLHQGADELPLCALNSLVQKLYSHLKPPAFVNEKRET